MARIKFKLDSGGVRELLKSQEIAGECQKHAEQTLSGCGGVEGYEIEQRSYPERTGFAVYAARHPAIRDNLSNNTLLKALK